MSKNTLLYAGPTHLYKSVQLMGNILPDKLATLFYSINYIKLGVDSIVHFQMLKVKIDEQKYFDRSSKKVCSKT